MSNLRNFGAVGDGKADDTKAIQHALAAGDGVLDGGNEDIPNGRVATSGASENSDTQNFFRA